DGPRLPLGPVPAPTGFRPAGDASRRRVPRAPPPQGPPRTGGRRVRRHRRPGDDGGSARGALRRDPRRVRRGGGDVSRLVLLFALGPLLAIRARAAAGEVMLALTGGPRRGRPGDREL